MRIEGKQLIEGIKKAKGVVAESSVIEHLRGFKFNPRDNGKLDIAGSDGRLTILAQIPFEESENSDGSQLTISSDILQQLIQYIDKDSTVEFAYESTSDNVTITCDNYVLKTHKKEFENEFIDFALLDEKDFDDEVDTKELAHVIGSLVRLAKLDSPDYMHQTIYLDGEFAFLYDGSIIAKIEFKTNAKYVIEHKSARQIQVLLGSTDADKVNLKVLQNGHEILLKTARDTIAFKVMEPEVAEVDFIDDFAETFSFKINRGDFSNAIRRTKLATDEEEIFLTIDKDDVVVRLKGIRDSGELATDEIVIEDIKGNITESEIDLLVNNYINLSDSIRTKDIIISVDTEKLYLMIKDTQNKTIALMTVNID